jgi:hypothetical protein
VLHSTALLELPESTLVLFAGSGGAIRPCRSKYASRVVRMSVLMVCRRPSAPGQPVYVGLLANAAGLAEVPVTPPDAEPAIATLDGGDLFDGNEPAEDVAAYIQDVLEQCELGPATSRRGQLTNSPRIGAVRSITRVIRMGGRSLIGKVVPVAAMRARCGRGAGKPPGPCNHLGMALIMEVYGKPERQRCCDCGGHRVFYSGEAYDASGTVAVFMTWLYNHDSVREVYTDGIFGTWGEDAVDDHVTFGSRTGPVEGSDEPASSLVTGGEMGADGPMIGQKLTREEALTHPLLPRFWEVNDLILNEIPGVHEHWTKDGASDSGPADWL